MFGNSRSIAEAYTPSISICQNIKHLLRINMKINIKTVKVAQACRSSFANDTHFDKNDLHQSRMNCLNFYMVLFTIFSSVPAV